MTIGKMDDIEEHTIYCDLLRYFRDAGHSVYTISPYEKRTGLQTAYEEKNGIHMLHVRTGNVTGMVSLIEKGLAQLSIEPIFIKAIKKYYSNVKFDLVMYSTPPITFCNAIEYVKRRDNAKTYLLLKDIFPQNAVDIGMMSKSGIKGHLYKFFRNKEKKLYGLSDYIGCMSPANVEYVKQNNPEIDNYRVEVCPNCIEVVDKSINEEERRSIRKKYDIPLEKRVFVYGGNLGKPQGIDFLIECLHSQENSKDNYFLIVGDGTEYGKIEEFVKSSNQNNIRLMKRLPQEDYDTMVGACDVGMIFLDHRFTIPNFPSRVLSYMQAKIPVLACTDSNTDIGKIIEEAGFGSWCESNDVNGFVECVNKIMQIQSVAEKEWNYLNKYYSTRNGYDIIMKHF
ncbi:glycosyltransferase family 4 protein [Blautia obeum]|uniref:glycosyltransferase family 4 protein n=2 Tax=Lachnospirales TaxID=3085636 RepID=UPI0035696D2E